MWLHMEVDWSVDYPPRWLIKGDQPILVLPKHVPVWGFINQGDSIFTTTHSLLDIRIHDMYSPNCGANMDQPVLLWSEFSDFPSWSIWAFHLTGNLKAVDLDMYPSSKTREKSSISVVLVLVLILTIQSGSFKVILSWTWGGGFNVTTTLFCFAGCRLSVGRW